MNRVLGIETSTGTASVALLNGEGELLGELTFAARRTMAQRLVPAIDQLLRLVDESPAAIDGIAVGLGPGSFTSLRVGLATAQGMALAGGPAVIGVGSLEAMAQAAPLSARQPVCAVISAPKRHVYAALYARLEALASNCLFGPDLLPLPDLAARLRQGGQRCAVVGHLAAADREELEQAGAEVLPALYAAPRAAVVALIGLQRLLRGERHAAADLTPDYVHPSEPEVRLGQTFARPGGPEAVDDGA